MQSENPVLADGQPGYAYDNAGGILKIGDGTTAWNDLMTVANSEWDGTDIPLPVSIANGGTGATNAGDARANLGIVVCTQSEYNSTSDKSGKLFFIVG